MRGKILRTAGVAAGALLAVSVLSVPAGAAKPMRFSVTVTNLTDGQALTPPLLVTHRKPIDLFVVGDAASLGLQEIAENGNLGPAIASLEGKHRVADIVAGTMPVVPSSRVGETGFPDSVTLEIDGGPGAKYLSWASMLICTNDGFSGLDHVLVPDEIGETFTFHTAGYDAGTELNTEDFADIVPPCQGLIGVTGDDPGTGETNPALAEGGVIHHHPGIQGGADLLPDVHGWTDPVARITITAIA